MHWRRAHPQSYMMGMMGGGPPMGGPPMGGPPMGGPPMGGPPPGGGYGQPPPGQPPPGMAGGRGMQQDKGMGRGEKALMYGGGGMLLGGLAGGALGFAACKMGKGPSMLTGKTEGGGCAGAAMKSAAVGGLACGALGAGYGMATGSEAPIDEYTAGPLFHLLKQAEGERRRVELGAFLGKPKRLDKRRARSAPASPYNSAGPSPCSSAVGSPRSNVGEDTLEERGPTGHV